jgi:hypothetical protein
MTPASAEVGVAFGGVASSPPATQTNVFGGREPREPSKVGHAHTPIRLYRIDLRATTAHSMHRARAMARKAERRYYELWQFRHPPAVSLR